MKKIITTGLALGIAAVLALFYAGCEDDPSMPNVGQYFQNNPYQSAARTTITATGVTITPTAATVSSLGQAVAFRAMGGNNSTFTWAVANGNGTITPAGTAARNDATYRVVALNPNSVIVYDSDGRSAAAPIAVAGADPLSIVPSTLRIAAAGGPVTLTVIGGLFPYTGVAVNDATLGAVGFLAPGSATIVYTPAAGPTNGVNVITVIDTNNDTASATITQQ